MQTSHILRQTRSFLVVCLVSSLQFLAIATANAQFGRDWIAGNGVWSTAGNWSPAGQPGAGEFAVFNSSAVVSTPNGTTAGALLIGTAANVTLDGGGSANLTTFLLSDPFLHNNIVEDATLTVRNGTFHLKEVDLGLDQSQQAGTLVVDSTATWQSTTTALGRVSDTEGRINVNGGRADFSLLDIGLFGSGTVILNGGRSDIGAIYLGGSGNGNLTIANQAIVNSGSTDADALGIDVDGIGSAVVTGASSRWNSASLIVGDMGSGTLLVQSGGTVATSQLSVALEPGSHGEITVDGVGSTMGVASMGPAVVGLGSNGKIAVTNGGAFNVGSGSGPGGTINLFVGGGVFGTGEVQGTLRNVAGTVFPGGGVGKLRVVGAFQQETTGKLTIEIAGNSASQTDLLQITGTATLGGTIDVQLANGYSPNPGDPFVVLTAGSIVNNGLALSPGAASLFSLTVDTTNNRVVVTRRAALAGDYNSDGVVDGADLLKWQRTLGSMTPPLDADGNHNGVIDAADLAVWKTHYGESAGSIVAITVVPEPQGAILAAVSALSALIWRREMQAA